MNPSAKRWIVAACGLLLLAAAVGSGWWYVNQNPAWWFWFKDQFEAARSWLGLAGDETGTMLTASGFIEATQVSVAAELGGRIVDILACEGDDVEAGAILVRLDDRLLRAQMQQAEAAVALAQAGLAQVKAGARPTALRQAEAELAQAEAARDAAATTWQDALAQVEDPQQVETAIIAARTDLEMAQYQHAQAQALANAAQAGRDLADDVLELLSKFGSAQAIDSARWEQAQAMYRSWQAWLQADAAKASERGARTTLEQLQQQRDNPHSLQAQATAAEVQMRLAEAAIGLAQAQLDGLKMGATPEQVALAEANVDRANAALKALEVQLDKQVLTAPINGLVVERPAQEGEVAVPGAAILTLANLDKVTLTLYVSEGDMGRVTLGAPVSVTVDAYPARAFIGRVTFIASEAEFTPRNVQTREDRVSMVFAVRVQLPNPDHALKPGMPADAVIGGPPESEGRP
jgi:multidrug efflux pump subunit AcrA (membrane-fusion protein)